MKKYAIIATSLLITSVLSGCGDSGSTHSPVAERLIGEPEIYSGNRHPVLLDSSNAEFYINTLTSRHQIHESINLFGPFIGMRGKAGNKISQQALLLSPQILKALLKSNKSDHDGNEVNTPCPIHGYIITGGQAEAGDKRFEYVNCQLYPGESTVNGVIETNKVFTGENLVITQYLLKQLSISHNGQKRIYSGLVGELPNNDNGVTSLMNYSEQDPLTGKINLISNLKQTVFNKNAQPDQIEGRIYQNDYGYVEISGNNHLKLLPDLLAGAITLKGASNSTVTLNFQESGPPIQYVIRLDQDGDGQTDQSSVLNANELYEGHLPGFSATSHPEAVIAEVYKGGGGGYSSGRHRVNHLVPLYAGYSNDTDGMFSELSFVWVLEEKPDGSIAKLTESTGIYNSLTPDVSGHYKISLKVMDADGLTDIDFRDFEIRE